ncbi:hypothetical protein F4811DRAFT_528026 [Daldinia bambusicola]|nr:hypothetical protein F4811DRAFT_528026 [Daldinia bambusicola]
MALASHILSQQLNGVMPERTVFYSVVLDFFFNLTRLGLSLAFKCGFWAVFDISVNGFLVLWDILERFGFKNDIPYTTISTISVAIEAVILPGIIAFMGITLWQIIQPLTTGNMDDGYIGLPTEYEVIDISLTVLWAPVAFFSGILLYHLLRGYIRERRDRKLRPILMFTETGDPVAIIPRVQHPNNRDRASRVSMDSLIQASGEPA